MAPSLKLVGTMCIVTLFVLECAQAQNCPSPLTFQPCLAYVGANSGLPDKNGQCCTLVKNPQLSDSCLCGVAKSRLPGVNEDKALGLAKACGRPVPVGTTCDGKPVPR